MATLTLIIGSILLFVLVFATWFTVWRLRIESRLKPIPVADDRPAHGLRKDASLGRDPE